MGDDCRFPPAHGDSMTNQTPQTRPEAAGIQTPVDNVAHSPADEAVTAADIARGVTRLLLAHAIAVIGELPLPDDRRADIVGLSADGTLTIVEIKSSLADFRSDQKWTAYRAYCDQLFFAVAIPFPVAILPADTGLILADRYGGSFERAAPRHPLAAARRKAMTLRFARTAAARLSRERDPGLAIDGFLSRL